MGQVKHCCGISRDADALFVIDRYQNMIISLFKHLKVAFTDDRMDALSQLIVSTVFADRLLAAGRAAEKRAAEE